MRHLTRGWLVIGLLLSATAYAVAEDFTLTTYFPSPRGIYNWLIASTKVVVGKTDEPEDSAMLELVADPNNPQGFLLPRVDDTQMFQIGQGLPADGLLVYNTQRQAIMSYRTGNINNWVPAGDSFWTTANGIDISNTNSGNVGIGIPAGRPLSAKLEVVDGAVWFDGAVGSGVGTTPTSGAGTRMMWIPDKAALRAGQVSSDQWDDANIGQASVAFGLDTIASGVTAMAVGSKTVASGATAFAAGDQTVASGNVSIAFGQQTVASGTVSTAMGFRTTASGANAMAMGEQTTASGIAAIAMGGQTIAAGDYSLAAGQWVTTAPATPNAIVLGSGVNLGGGLWVPLVNAVPNSLMVGFNSTTPTLHVGPGAGSTPGNVGIGQQAGARRLEVNGAMKLADEGSQPTCDPTTRGTLWVDFNTGKDTVTVCTKDAANAYAWRTIY